MRSFLTILTLSLASGCSSATDDEARTGEASANGEKCQIDPPGEDFVFHIVNDGDEAVEFVVGCVNEIPIQIGPPDDLRFIAPEGATTCGFNCDSIYNDGASHAEGACSDCGISFLTAVAGGETIDFVWDRRTYQPHTVAAACSGHDEDNFCALGTAADPAIDRGVLTYSRVSQGGEVSELEFQFDQSKAAAEITID